MKVNYVGLGMDTDFQMQLHLYIQITLYTLYAQRKSVADPEFLGGGGVFEVCYFFRLAFFKGFCGLTVLAVKPLFFWLVTCFSTCYACNYNSLGYTRPDERCH